jgi:D-alanyl-D-alanine carboxypeptidase (penicillin-binding protein 5/6)
MQRCCLAFLLTMTGLCQAQETPIPAPPQIAASSLILMDFTTGEVLAESNADSPVEPASITKLMTGYVVFKALDGGLVHIDDTAYISEAAWRTDGSRMFVEVGTRVPLQDLMRGMIIQSGNDASVALAEHVAGSEEAFVDLMNQYAAGLGMLNTSYRNSTGLPAEGHYSTARDSAIIARAIISEFPQYYALYSEREFMWNDIRQPNRNDLLARDAAVDGLKTGHTDAAGYCLVSSAKRDDMRLIAVVMGAPSVNARLDGSQALLNYGFRFFETRKLFSQGEQVTESRVWKGEQKTVGLGVAEDVYVTAPRGQADALAASAQVTAQLIAPLEANVDVGTVSVTYHDTPKLSVPLVTLSPVAEAGLWTRMLDEVALWLE